MKKCLFIFLFISICSLAWGKARQYNSQTGAKDYCIEFSDESENVKNSRCLDIRVPDGALVEDDDDFFLLRSQLVKGASTSLTTSQGDPVPVTHSYIQKSIGSDDTFDTGTLPDGDDGQLLTIEIIEVAEGNTWTLTPDTSTGFDSVTFFAVGQSASFLYIDDDVGWIVLVSTVGSHVEDITSVSANYTASGIDENIICDTSGGAFTVTLEPDPVTGQVHTIILDTGPYELIIFGNGKAVGGTSQIILTTSDSVQVIYNGTQWNIK